VPPNDGQTDGGASRLGGRLGRVARRAREVTPSADALRALAEQSFNRQADQANGTGSPGEQSGALEPDALRRRAAGQLDERTESDVTARDVEIQRRPTAGEFAARLPLVSGDQVTAFGGAESFDDRAVLDEQARADERAVTGAAAVDDSAPSPASGLNDSLPDPGELTPQPRTRADAIERAIVEPQGQDTPFVGSDGDLANPDPETVETARELTESGAGPREIAAADISREVDGEVSADDFVEAGDAVRLKTTSARRLAAASLSDQVPGTVTADMFKPVGVGQTPELTREAKREVLGRKFDAENPGDLQRGQDFLVDLTGDEPSINVTDEREVLQERVKATGEIDLGGERGVVEADPEDLRFNDEGEFVGLENEGGRLVGGAIDSFVETTQQGFSRAQNRLFGEEIIGRRLDDLTDGVGTGDDSSPGIDAFFDAAGEATGVTFANPVSGGFARAEPDDVEQVSQTAADAAVRGIEDFFTEDVTLVGTVPGTRVSGEPAEQLTEGAGEGVVRSTIGLPAEGVAAGQTGAAATEFTAKAVEQEGVGAGAETAAVAGANVAAETATETGRAADRNPTGFLGQALGSAAVSTLAGPRIVRAGERGLVRARATRQADIDSDITTRFEELSSAESVEDPSLPDFDTDTGAPARQARAEIERRARDQPDALQEAVGSEQVLLRSESERLPGDLEAQRGNFELPGLFVSPELSQLRLSGAAQSSGGIRLLPRLRAQPERVSAFEAPDIESAPPSAVGSGFAVRDGDGEIVERFGPGQGGKAKALAESIDGERVPDPDTPGARFLDEQAERGTAFVRPTGDRTTELEAIFPPGTRFERAETGRVDIDGEPGTLDAFRLAPPGEQPDSVLDALPDGLPDGLFARDRVGTDTDSDTVTARELSNRESRGVPDSDPVTPSPPVTSSGPTTPSPPSSVLDPVSTATETPGVSESFSSGFETGGTGSETGGVTGPRSPVPTGDPTSATTPSESDRPTTPTSDPTPPPETPPWGQETPTTPPPNTPTGDINVPNTPPPNTPTGDINVPNTPPPPPPRRREDDDETPWEELIEADQTTRGTQFINPIARLGVPNQGGSLGAGSFVADGPTAPAPDAGVVDPGDSAAYDEFAGDSGEGPPWL